MRNRTLRAGLVAALLSLLGATPASAAVKPLTGKLSTSGYTVIALAADGEATSDEAKDGKFKLRPPANRVTLHLRDDTGRYAGPMVFGGKGKKAIVGLKSAGSLGKVKVRGGYSEPRREVPTGLVDRTRTATARKGVPIGAGNFGLVETEDGGHSHDRRAGGGSDADLDGVPNTLDVDGNGNLILDNQDAAGPEPGFFVFSQIGRNLEGSLNANASGVSDAQIDSLVQGSTTPPFQPQGVFLVMQVVDGDEVELDCGELSWCSPGGTGRSLVTPDAPDPGPEFPECCDPDGDGFGTMTASQGPSGKEFTLYPLATASQIGAGDLLVQRSTTRGTETQVPAALNFVFNTTPALIAWQSTGGEAATVSYPVPGGAAGTRENPFAVQDGPNGEVIVTLSFWKPQRRAIPGADEGSGFIDIGHLVYHSRIVGDEPSSPIGGRVLECPASAYSTADPRLTPNPDPMLSGFVDQSGDAPADPANTLSYSLNLSACLAANGATWSPGESIQVELVARTQGGGDNSAQTFHFKRQ